MLQLPSTMSALYSVAHKFTAGVLTPKYFLVGAMICTAAVIFARAGLARVANALNALIIAGVVASVLAVMPRPLVTQPFPDSHELADSTQRWVSGNGYTTRVHGNRPQPPMYPPGFPLALAPFAAVSHDYPSDVQRGATFYAAIYVFTAAIAAWSLRGSAASAVIALLIGISPFARVEASVILSDALAVALTILLVPLLKHPTDSRVSVAAVVAGALIAIRLPMFVVLVSLFLALPTASWRRLVAYSAPPLAALAIFNWRTFGSVFRTGYHYYSAAGLRSFRPGFAVTSPMPGDGPWIIPDVLGGTFLRWTCPCPPGGPQAAMSNPAYYAAVLAGLFWLFLPPLVPLVGAVYMWRNRRSADVRFALSVIVFTFLLFIFYDYQGARFMAAPVTLLGVFAAAEIARLIAPLKQRVVSRPNSA